MPKGGRLALVCYRAQKSKMAYLNKEYKLDREENFESFLKGVGVPEPLVQKYLSFKPATKLTKNGDTYTYITDTLDGVNETSFKSGIEFEGTIQNQNVPIKTTYTVDGNVITQLIKTDKGDANFKREYIGDELVVTLTSSMWDGVAKRYYKA